MGEKNNAKEDSDMPRSCPLVPCRVIRNEEMNKMNWVLC
jgi:hypothetical protein